MDSNIREQDRKYCLYQGQSFEIREPGEAGVIWDTVMTEEHFHYRRNIEDSLSARPGVKTTRITNNREQYQEIIYLEFPAKENGTVQATCSIVSLSDNPRWDVFKVIDIRYYEEVDNE